MSYSAKLGLVMASCVMIFSFNYSAHAGENEIVIGSGGRTGVYYPVAISICRIFNAQYRSEGYGCSVVSTGGSVDNLRKLSAGEINFAIVQSDWQSHAYKGTSVFSVAGPNEQLRSAFALYSESFTVLAQANSNINQFEDLLNHRVNIGNPGSGQRATMEIVMRAYNWSRFDFTLVREFGSKFQAQALCDGEIEAIIFVAGHPSGTIKNATEKCATNFVSVESPLIDKLVSENDYYRKAVIPAGVYFGQTKDIPTFGVNATMVTLSGVKSELVNLFVKSIFTNLDKFRSMHPALANLQATEMKKDIMPAPMHRGAKLFFDEIKN